MAAALSNYMGNLILKALLNGTNLTAPTTVYMGLATGSVSSSELSGGSYGRQAVTFASLGSGLTSSNTSDATFINLPTASIAYIQLWDAPTSGHFLFAATIDVSGTPTPTSVTAGDSVTFAAGRLTIVFTGLA